MTTPKTRAANLTIVDRICDERGYSATVRAEMRAVVLDGWGDVHLTHRRPTGGTALGTVAHADRAAHLIYIWPSGGKYSRTAFAQ